MRTLLLGSLMVLASCSGDGASEKNTANEDPDGGGTSANTGDVNGGGSGAASTAGTGNASSGGTGATNGGATGGTTGSVTPGDLPTVGGCPVFTADDAWNTKIDTASVNTDYTARLQRYLSAEGNPRLHPDFGADLDGQPFGIPINVVPMNQASLPISFDYDDESDPGPYPFPGPNSVKIEGNDPHSSDGDRHILAVQEGACVVYEAWACSYGTSSYQCGSGAKFDLRKNSYGQRTKGFTSADAAGLSILAGLIRYDETMAGTIRHAIRFTLGCTVAKYTKPASHYAVPRSCDPNDPNAMPMGVRVRLKASYDLSRLRGAAKVVAQAMKTYGMILADNGSDFYFQGESDTRWNDEDLNGLKTIPSSEFEVVDPVSLEP